jgi:Zn-dependent alcohol dehydrogenase
MKAKAAIAIKAGAPHEIEMVDLEGPKDDDPEGAFPAILGHEGKSIRSVIKY